MKRNSYFIIGVVVVVIVALIFAFSGNGNDNGSNGASSGSSGGIMKAISSNEDKCAEAMFVCYKPCTSLSGMPFADCLIKCSKVTECSGFTRNTEEQNQAFVNSLSSANKQKMDCLNNCENSELSLADCFKGCLN